MFGVMNAENMNREVEQQQPQAPRGRGRPKGSKNKRPLMAEGWSHEKTSAYTRKWQKVDKIRPQFSVSRKDATEILFDYLRSVRGRTALRDMIVNGSPGIGKLSDVALGKYLELTGLLSRYPHDVIVKA